MKKLLEVVIERPVATCMLLLCMMVIGDELFIEFGKTGNACYVYPDSPATPGMVTPDVVYERGIYMNGSITMDDGNNITIWGCTRKS